MKDTKAFFAGSLLTLLLIAGIGCAGMFSGKKAPNAFEQRHFETTTNYIDEIASKAVEIKATNSIPQADGTVVESITAETVTVFETNSIPVYTLAAKAESVEDAQVIGSIANLVAPGSGPLVGGLLAGMLGLWARLRSHKKTGTVLAQNIQGIRAFIKSSVPEGTKYDAALTEWMSDKQTETGTVNAVLSILQRHVNNKDARAAALEMENLLKALAKDAT